jgi:3-deoxy-D-manno-octulosonate 8-phosphate phosphatase (KDO 8-P phosphatase)
MQGEIGAELVRGIRLVLLDVDGVLTDNGVYIGATESGEPVEVKRFHVRDGLGIKLLQWAGLEVGLVSGRISKGTAIRAAELGIACHQDNGGYKLAAVEALLRQRGIEWQQVAFMGDDLPDLAVMSRVGLPITVADAVPEIRRTAAWTAELSGGHGAVREMAEALLRARGQWDATIDDYVKVRQGAMGEFTGSTA